MFSRKNQKHIARDTLSKAIRSLNNSKWKVIATPHGFSSFFKTLTTTNLAYLMQNLQNSTKNRRRMPRSYKLGYSKKIMKEKKPL